MTSLPLEGVRVLDLSRLLPGGFCSLLLADYGADVLKVEDIGIGDYIRWSPPYVEGPAQSARSALFLALNRNKRSIRIDLRCGACSLKPSRMLALVVMAWAIRGPDEIPDLGKACPAWYFPSAPRLARSPSRECGRAGWPRRTVGPAS